MRAQDLYLAGCIFLIISTARQSSVPNGVTWNSKGDSPIEVQRVIDSNWELLNLSLYIGGSKNDRVLSSHYGEDGYFYLTGETSSPDISIVGDAANSTFGGDLDAFVSKYSIEGELIFSTYLGGISRDSGNSITVDKFGNIYVVGRTRSPNFPTIGEYADSTFGGGGLSGDAFISKFNQSGHLIFSTFHGAQQNDLAWSVVVDDNQSIYLTGDTNSDEFPIAGENSMDNTWISSSALPTDVFVSKFDKDGKLIFSSMLGGWSTESGRSIGLDAEGNFYVAGDTSSQNFQIIGKFANSQIRSFDAGFVSKFDQSGSLIYSSYIDGSGEDSSRSIFVTADGFLYITGETNGELMRINEKDVETAVEGDSTVYILKMNQSGYIEQHAFLGGESADQTKSIFVDGSGRVILTGMTKSCSFPLIGRHAETILSSSSDLFISVFDDKFNLQFSTLFGGSASDIGHSIKASVDGRVLVVGETESLDFPVLPTSNSQYGGDRDGFVLLLNPVDLADQIDLLGDVSSADSCISSTESNPIFDTTYSSVSDIPFSGTETNYKNTISVDRTFRVSTNDFLTAQLKIELMLGLLVIARGFKRRIDTDQYATQQVQSD
ncbi:MAG: SBBP repeat-containing protein [Candidatus Heimdallarchaeota archaeon]|nr:SBBP repeat-containing protein [Candidatus Heimdallarchaeota archaeon]